MARSNWKYPYLTDKRPRHYEIKITFLELHCMSVEILQYLKVFRDTDRA